MSSKVRKISDKPIDIHAMPAQVGGPRSPVLPYFFERIIDLIEKRIDTLDIHQRDGVQSEVQRLYDNVSVGLILFDETTDPHVLTTLLRKVIRNLKKPLIDDNVLAKLKEAVRIEEDFSKATDIERALLGLGNTRYKTLEFLFQHLNKIAKSDKNNTSAAKLTELFTVTLFNNDLSKPRNSAAFNELQQLYIKITEFLINKHRTVFNRELEQKKSRC